MKQLQYVVALWSWPTQIYSLQHDMASFLFALVIQMKEAGEIDMVLWSDAQNIINARNYICHKSYAAISSVFRHWSDHHRKYDEKNSFSILWFFLSARSHSQKLAQSNSTGLPHMRNLNENENNVFAPNTSWVDAFLNFIKRWEIYLGFYDMILIIECSHSKS